MAVYTVSAAIALAAAASGSGSVPTTPDPLGSGPPFSVPAGTGGSRLTYSDAVEHAFDYLGGSPDAPGVRDARRSVLAAYREVCQARTWTYLYEHGRYDTHAPYETGTVAYDADTRRLLLTGGAWPPWAAGGDVRIGVVTHRCSRRVSDTTLLLDPVLNPGVGIDFAPHPVAGASHATPVVVTALAHGLAVPASPPAAGYVPPTVVVEGVLGNTAANGTWTATVLDANHFSVPAAGNGAYTAGGTWRLPPTTTYTLYQDTYLMPADHAGSDTQVYQENYGGLTFIHPTDHMWGHRYIRSAGTPFYYTFTGDDRYPGRIVTRLFPYPDQAKTIDFVYHRLPRDLAVAAYSDGTVTTAGGSTALVGNGTAFTPNMVGSVVRIGTAKTVPTSQVGASPALFETRVTDYVSPTRLNLADQPPAVDQFRYVISDPLDVDPAVMTTAFFRCVEKHVSIARTVPGKGDAFAAYDMALREARAADSKSFQGRAVGAPRSRHLHPKYMPAKFF